MCLFPVIWVGKVTADDLCVCETKLVGGLVEMLMVALLKQLRVLQMGELLVSFKIFKL